MTIRHATISDIDNIIDLCTEMHNEGYYKNISIVYSKLKIYILEKINNNNSLILILESHSSTIGMFIADIVEYFFSDETISIDNLFFITKPERKFNGAKKLLDAYFEWAIAHNVKEITLSTTNGVEVEKIEKMYSKLGFTKVGIMYKKGV